MHLSEDGTRINVYRTKLYVGHDVVRDSTKTYESTRSNKPPPYLLHLIQQVSHKSEKDFIVPLGYQFIKDRFRKLMDRAGYDITFHKLRHSFATTLNDLGIPSNYIQKLGGWSSDNIMKTVYTHTTISKEDAYQKIIDDFFMSVIGTPDA